MYVVRMPNEKSHLAEEPRVFTGARPIPFRVLCTTHSRRRPAREKRVARPGKGEEALKESARFFPVGNDTGATCRAAAESILDPRQFRSP